MTDTQQAKTDASKELKPLNWEAGNIAISPTHFYMIYNDPNKGVTVRWTNRFNDRSNVNSDFDSIKKALDWVKTAHYPRKQKQYEDYCKSACLRVGQRWASKTIKYLILEIVAAQDHQIYSKAYIENKPDSASDVLGEDAKAFDESLRENYCLMLGSETVDECLLRHGGYSD